MCTTSLLYLRLSNCGLSLVSEEQPSSLLVRVSHAATQCSGLGIWHTLLTRRPHLDRLHSLCSFSNITSTKVEITM